MTKREPDWLLERYRLGELSADERARVEADPSMKERLAALEADDAAILERHPPARVAASVRAAAAEQPGRWWSLVAVAVPVGVAASIALFVAIPRTDDDVRLKGAGAQLSVFRMTAQGPERLADGATVRGGDVVQARYHLDEAGAVTLLSFDALGQVTVHVNEATQAPGAHAMNASFELDGAPGFERFMLVTGKGMTLEALTAQAQAIARSDSPTQKTFTVPDGVSQRSVVLLKHEVR